MSRERLERGRGIYFSVWEKLDIQDCLILYRYTTRVNNSLCIRLQLETEKQRTCARFFLHPSLPLSLALARSLALSLSLRVLPVRLTDSSCSGGICLLLRSLPVWSALSSSSTLRLPFLALLSLQNAQLACQLTASINSHTILCTAKADCVWRAGN